MTLPVRELTKFSRTAPAGMAGAVTPANLTLTHKEPFYSSHFSFSFCNE
jgi:hypothetical protein